MTTDQTATALARAALDHHAHGRTCCAQTVHDLIHALGQACPLCPQEDQ